MGETILRPYRDPDLEKTLDLWCRAWNAAMPEIDFNERLSWWRKRWLEDLVPKNNVTVAHKNERLVGFVVIDPKSGYLDQIVVDPKLWGSDVARNLLNEAKRQSPGTILLDVNQSNIRAVRFYERTGFERISEGKNALSGKPTWNYVWKA